MATFVYKEDAISNVCLQCSQETADLRDNQVGDIRITLQAEYLPQTYPDASSVIEKRNRIKSKRLPVYPLSHIDMDHEIANYFEKKYTRMLQQVWEPLYWMAVFTYKLPKHDMGFTHILMK